MKTVQKFKLEHSLKSQKGFTLSGVMIALGVVSVLGLIIASFSTTATRMFSDIEKTNAVNEVLTEMRLTLSNGRVCMANLGGKSFSMGNVTGTAIPNIRNFGPGNTEAGTVLQVNQVFRGLKVKQLQLVPASQLSDSLIMAELQATFEKDTADENAKGLEMKRSVPLLLRVQNNQIEECWAKKPVPEGAYSSICDTTTDGALNDTDPATGECTLANGVWIRGGVMSATCPARAFLPAAADALYNCRPVIPPGFEDTFPKTSVNMTSGPPLEQGRSFYVMSLDKAAKTCNCNWATDIPAGTLSNFRCEILCLVP